MHELIERLENATGPDRELGNDILYATGWTVHEIGEGDIRSAIWTAPRGEEYREGDHPDPTTSIDTALTLVPENGRLLELGQWQDNGQPDGWFAQVTKWIKSGEHGWIDQGFAYGVPEYGATKKPRLAPNGAIALCIAALKAHAALNIQQRGK